MPPMVCKFLPVPKGGGGEAGLLLVGKVVDSTTRRLGLPTRDVGGTSLLLLLLVVVVVEAVHLCRVFRKRW